MSTETPPAVSDAMREAIDLNDLCDRLDRQNTVLEPQACADTMDEARLALVAAVAEITRLTGERDAAIALAEAAERNLMARLKTSRWNVMEGENGNVFVCHGHHEKSEDCEWIEYVPAEAAEAETARLRAALEPFAKLDFSFDGFSLDPAEMVVFGRLCGKFWPKEHDHLQRAIHAARIALTSQEQADV